MRVKVKSRKKGREDKMKEEKTQEMRDPSTDQDTPGCTVSARR